MLSKQWIQYYRTLLLLIFFVLSCHATARDIRLHLFFSNKAGALVYLVGQLSETALHRFQETVPGFASKRKQLNDDERLLVIKFPAASGQETLFEPVGVRLYPAGFLSGYTPCGLQSPEDIYFPNRINNPDTPDEPYQLKVFRGKIDTHCSQFMHNGTAELSYFPTVAMAGSELLPLPEDLSIIEVPPQNNDKKLSGMPGIQRPETNLLTGRGSSFWSKFDFRPGGAGPSNLLDISIMQAFKPLMENSDDSEAADAEEQIVIHIVDSTGREWQQTYTRGQARKLLAGIDDGDDLVARIHRLDMMVTGEIMGDLSSVCRESYKQLSQLLSGAGRQAVPGVILLDGGKKDASTQTSDTSGQNNSGSSGSGSATGGAGHSSSLSGGSCGGSSGRDRDRGDEKKPPAQSAKPPAKKPAAVKNAYIYSFIYQGKKYELEVQSTDESVSRYVCSFCRSICRSAGTYCNNHYDCRECLEKQNKHIHQRYRVCPKCRTSLGKEVIIAPFVDYLIRRLVVNCPGAEHGCTKTPQIGNLESHCAACPDVMIKCNNVGCSASVLRRNLPEHHNVCRYQSVKCVHCKDGCTVTGMRKDMESHPETCGYEAITCPTPDCQKKIPRHSITTHLNECPFVMLTCNNEPCHSKFLRKDSEHHKQTECLYQPIPCEFCQTAIRRLELPGHSQICDSRTIECGLCGDSIPYCTVIEHFASCIESPEVQDPGTAFRLLQHFSAFAATRDAELTEKVGRLENELSTTSKKSAMLEKELAMQQEISKSSKQQLAEKLDAATQKGQDLESLLKRSRHTVACEGFQLHLFDGTNVYKAYQAEKEKLSGYFFFVISPKTVIKYLNGSGTPANPTGTEACFDVYDPHHVRFHICTGFSQYEIMITHQFIVTGYYYQNEFFGNKIYIGLLKPTGEIEHQLMYDHPADDEVMEPGEPYCCGEYLKVDEIDDYTISGHLVIAVKVEEPDD